MDSSRPSHLIEVLQALKHFAEILVIHILRIWALLYNVLENYRKTCNVSLFSPSLQIQWFIQAMPRCCAAARRGFNGRELNFHV